MNRSSILLFKLILLLLTVSLIFFNACTSESQFGKSTLTSENVDNPIWLKQTFPEYNADIHQVDSTYLKVSFSRKNVMKGFLNSKDNILGNFLLNMTPFNNPKNRNSKSEYSFFDGENDNILITSTLRENLFKESEYNSKANNLHKYFRFVSNEFQSSSSTNTFYVLVSDGETIIKERQTLNESEESELKEAIKDILKENPNTQIGLLAIPANFYGQYAVELDKPILVKCVKYLYAICIFDKRFLGEFDQIAQLTGSDKSFALLLNPQIPTKYYTPNYLTKEIDGQKNMSKEPYFAAFPVVMDGKDVEITLKNTFHLKNIQLPEKTTAMVTSYTQIDTFKFGNPSIIEDKAVNLESEIKITVKAPKNSTIVKVDYNCDYNKEIETLLPIEFLSLSIEDNTYDQVKIINPNEVLRTEGLKDLIRLMFQAFDESKKMPIATNFIQLGNFNIK